MRAFLVALIITLLMLPAYARGRGGGKQNPAASAASDEQKRKNAQQEKDYKSALDRIPDKKPADPWANMR